MCLTLHVDSPRDAQRQPQHHSADLNLNLGLHARRVAEFHSSNGSCCCLCQNIQSVCATCYSAGLAAVLLMSAQGGKHTAAMLSRGTRHHPKTSLARLSELQLVLCTVRCAIKAWAGLTYELINKIRPRHAAVAAAHN